MNVSDLWELHFFACACALQMVRKVRASTSEWPLLNDAIHGSAFFSAQAPISPRLPFNAMALCLSLLWSVIHLLLICIDFLLVTCDALEHTLRKYSVYLRVPVSTCRYVPFQNGRNEWKTFLSLFRVHSRICSFFVCCVSSWFRRHLVNLHSGTCLCASNEELVVVHILLLNKGINERKLHSSKEQGMALTKTDAYTYAHTDEQCERIFRTWWLTGKLE